jgi:hypothetical protein
LKQWQLTNVLVGYTGREKKDVKMKVYPGMFQKRKEIQN